MKKDISILLTLLIMISMCMGTSRCGQSDIVAPPNSNENNDTSEQDQAVIGTNPKKKAPYNDDSSKRKLDAALEGYLILPNVIIPIETAGSLGYYDDDTKKKKMRYVSLISDDSYAKPQMVNEVVFKSIVDKGFSANIDCLSFFSAGMESQDKAEILIEKVFVASGPKWLDKKIQQKISTVAKNKNKQYYYIKNIAYLTAVTKKYELFKGEAKGSYYVTAGGDVYNSSDETNLMGLTAIYAIPFVIKENGPEFGFLVDNIPVKSLIDAFPDNKYVASEPNTAISALQSYNKQMLHSKRIIRIEEALPASF